MIRKSQKKNPLENERIFFRKNTLNKIQTSHLLKEKNRPHIKSLKNSISLFILMLTRTHFRHALPEPIAQETQATQNFKK